VLVKRFVCAAVALVTLNASHVMAACTPPFMTATQIQTLLANNTACVGHTPTAQWSEWHNGGATGTVVDWKLGASNPVDPTKAVGTYTISLNFTAGTVTYNYTGGGTYAYYVQQGSANPYTFCNTSGSPVLSVTVNPGQGPC
jgi:hypothetical protein